MSDDVKHFYEFGEFRLDAEGQTLWRGDEMVPIFPKALEILILLVQKRGSTVSREELMATVWRDTYVEEANITYTVSVLRKTLAGDKGAFIQTVPKRGYRFTAAVSDVSKNGYARMGGANDSSFARSTDDENVSAFDDKSKTWRGFITKPASIISFAVATILVSLLVVAGFRYWFEQASLQSLAPIENVNFRKLTFTGDLTFPVLAPDGRSFAFVRDGGLFIQEVGSGVETRLSIADENIYGISQFSPDGKLLYFRNRVGFDVAGSVFQVSRLGGNPSLVAENVWSGFSISPDGRRISFVRVNPGGADSHLVIRDIESGSEKTLAPLNLPATYLDNGHPAWSPDGQKIAVVLFRRSRGSPASELLAIDVESGRIDEIKCPQLWQFEQVAWLPDGRDLIVSARENGKFFQLWRIVYPECKVQKITNDLNIYRGLSLSNDGKNLLARQFTLFSHLWIGESQDLVNLRQKTFGNLNRDGVAGIHWMPNGDVLFVARIMGDNDLWLYRRADDSLLQLTKNAGALNINPTVSADGSSIFFNSTRNGAHHVWRMDASGENQTQITFGEKQIEIHPQISPDGASLYYIQKSPTSSAVWRKPLAGGVAEVLTEAGELSPDSFLSLSPDGRFLAFHNAVEKVNEEGEKQIYQIGIIPTDKPYTPNFLKIAATRLIVRWTSDGTALDFIENYPDGARIWRQSIDATHQPSIVMDMPKTFLHNFAWSVDGEKLVLSRGQQTNDAILLTDFWK